MPNDEAHGGPGLANVVAPRTDRVVLLDLERCTVRPHDRDLVPTAVKYATYGGIA
jgi:hypothetical protein